MQAFSVISVGRGYNPDMPGGRPPKSTTRSDFGERLFQARIAKGMSQTQVAEALGIRQPSYADWERRAVSLKPEYLPKLAELYEISVEHLLGIEEPRKPAKAGPSGRLRRLLDEVGDLPRYQQQRIIAMVEDMIVAHRAKKAS